MNTIIKGKFLKSCKNKCRATARKVKPSESPCDSCCKWPVWAHESDRPNVPKDVPKGHLVVYVGQAHKRHVIKVALLKHPLFQALLDQAQEAYDFTSDFRLCIPCDETVFLSVVHCARSPPDHRCL